MADAKQYAERDPMALDKAGGNVVCVPSAVGQAVVSGRFPEKSLQIADRDRRIKALTKALRDVIELYENPQWNCRMCAPADPCPMHEAKAFDAVWSNARKALASAAGAEE